MRSCGLCAVGNRARRIGHTEPWNEAFLRPFRTAHNSALLNGASCPTGDQHDGGDRRAATAASVVGAQRPPTLCAYRRLRRPDPVRRVNHENKAALARLLEVLRAKGAIPDRLSLNDHIGHELVQFDGHMRDIEGLALNTRRQRCHIIRRFLVKQFGPRPIELSKVDPSAVRRFDPGLNGAFRIMTVTHKTIAVVRKLEVFHRLEKGLRLQFDGLRQ
jgi:hypothetical protein